MTVAVTKNKTAPKFVKGTSQNQYMLVGQSGSIGMGIRFKGVHAVNGGFTQIRVRVHARPLVDVKSRVKITAEYLKKTFGTTWPEAHDLRAAGWLMVAFNRLPTHGKAYNIGLEGAIAELAKLINRVAGKHGLYTTRQLQKHLSDLLLVGVEAVKVPTMERNLKVLTAGFGKSIEYPAAKSTGGNY